MSSSPDYMQQLMQGLLNVQQPSGITGGLLSGNDPTTQLGLSLLSNSNSGGRFGQILGQSAMQTQQLARDRQLQQLQMAQAAMGLGLSVQKQQALTDILKGQNQSLPQMASSAVAQTAPPPMLQAPGNGYNPSDPSTAMANQPQASSQQTAQPQQFAADQIDQIPINGLSPDVIRKYDLINGKDPLETNKAIRAQQLEIAQRSIKPQVDALDTIIKSDNPSQYVQSHPALQNHLAQGAQLLGIDLSKGINDQIVRTALTAQRNAMASAAQLGQEAPPNPLKTITLPDGRTAQVDPVSGKISIEASSSMEKVLGKDGKPTLVPTALSRGMTPYSEAVASAQRFQGGPAALLGSLALKGVALPAGLRSQQQQLATLQGLIDKYPDLSPDQIAEKVAQGQITFGSEKKAASTAAGIAGRTATAENEILDMGPLLLSASAKVPRGSFVPINKLLQMKDTAISDPNLKQLKIYVNSMLNAYDQLAARGGTDKNKRAEAHSLLTSAEGPEALRAGIEAFQNEASIAKHASEKAAGLPQSASPQVGGHPPDIQAILDKYN